MESVIRVMDTLQEEPLMELVTFFLTPFGHIFPGSQAPVGPPIGPQVGPPVTGIPF